MSDLTAIEKRKLERALEMGGGYVLNFSNRTFAEFFLDSTGLDIYDAKYDRGSSSKANRMRAFWDQESNYLVGKVLGILFEEWKEFSGSGAPPEPPGECLKIVRRLMESAPVPNSGAGMPGKFDATTQKVNSSASRASGEPGSHPKVFICHSKQDTARAEELYDELCSAGADPWVDKRKLVLGDAWETEIKKAVAEADVFVVCLRPGFDEIGFRQKEVRWAIEAVELRPPGRGFIIPFIVEPCPLPDWCKPLHAGDHLSGPTTVEDLLRAVEKHCLWTRRA